MHETGCLFCGWPEVTWRDLCKVHELTIAASRAAHAGLPDVAASLLDAAGALREAREGLEL